MSKSMKLSAFYEKPELLMKLFGWVSAGVMLFNMVLICCDVFMRYAFNSPIQGTTEIVTMLMAWVAYAGMGYTLLKGQHMQLGCRVRQAARPDQAHLQLFHLPAGHNPVCCHDQSVLGPVLGLLADQREVGGRRDGVCILGKFGCFLGWLLLAIQGAFMTVYCAVGIARPNQVDPILIKSELPSEDELGAFGVEGTQNAEKDGDG